MSSVRTAVPWYVHPAEDPEAWARLASRRPRSSFVVVNVHDGPGGPGDPWYPAALEPLRGLRLLGYVDVAYGERAPADVQRDVRAWWDLYRIGGVMFDRFPSDAATTGRCVEYVFGARRATASFVAGNPGVVPALGHLALLDVTCVFEGSADDYAGFGHPAALRRVPRSRIWHLVHTCPAPAIGAVWERAGQLGAGHAFVTDRSMPHPWGGLPLSDRPEVGGKVTS